MAVVYKTVKGRKTTNIIALHETAQRSVDEHAFQIAENAERLLLEHRAEGHSAIDIDKGDVDTYVVLTDERGEKAALSIEYGRFAGSKIVKDRTTGEEREITWGSMEGLYILHRASNLPKRRGKKVRF